MRRVHPLTGALALALVLAGCKPSCTPEPPKERALVLATLTEPDTLDPVFTEAAGAQEIVRLLFRDLTDYDERWQVHPSLAAEMPAIETATGARTRARWKLRPGLRWSDGAPLTARDVAFGQRIEADPALESAAQSFAKQVERIEVQGPLDFTVTWRTQVPGADAPRVHAILPEHAYPEARRGAGPFTGLGRTPISSGPYRLRSWDPGRAITLERNPHWSGARPQIDVLVFRFFQTEDSYEGALRTGGIDALGEASGLGIDTAKRIAEKLEATHVVTFTESSVWLHLAARLDDPITGDLEVRRAIDRAIDRKELAALAYEGEATPAGGCFPPLHPGHAAPAPAGADPDAARAILDAAGWRGSPRERGGKPLRLSLELGSGSRASERAGAYLERALGAIGVQVSLSAMPVSALFARMRKKEHAPLVLYAWRAPPDWDAASILGTGGAQNYGGFSDPEIDRLLAAAARAPDRAAWAAELRKVDARYRELLPTIPLLFRRSVSVRPRGLTGWRPTGSTTPVTWNAEEWSLTEGSSGRH